jgi:hypothetical protein
MLANAYNAYRAISRYRSSLALVAVYRRHRLEKRRKQSGLLCESLEYSKGGPRLCKHERAISRQRGSVSYVDDCRLLADGAGVPSRRTSASWSL